MCGIYGLMNGTKSRKVSTAISKMIHDGMVVNSLRGMDSTGVFQRDKKNVTFTHKLAVNGAEFVKDKYTLSFIDDADQAVYTVVHNRAATEGSVSEANAHPFEALDEQTYNYTCGVHNGTLAGWKTKPRGGEFEVDSQWAITHINSYGNDAFKDFSGAYAMVWNSDHEGGVLKMARNSARPLYFVFVKDEDRMVFASEYQMITWIAERNNIILEPEIYELAPNFIYSFDVNNPRTFTRVTTPFMTQADYEQKRRADYIKEVEGILRPSKKSKAAKKREQAEQARKAATVSSALPVPLLPSSSVAAAIEQGTTQPPKYCNQAEFQLAKKLGVLRTEVSFEGWAFDSESGEWWGSIGEGEDMVSCVIRNMNKSLYDVLNRAQRLKCRIVGAISGPDGNVQEVSYILSRNFTDIQMEDKDSQNKELEETIRASLDAHKATKAIQNAADQTSLF